MYFYCIQMYIHSIYSIDILYMMSVCPLMALSYSIKDGGVNAPF